jgi:cyclophilin family peptidyl-prolyl cis-trans isomerase
MSKVKITTHHGDMICELYDNETPITVKNFLQLIAKKFYDGLNFHRVIPGFMIQGGCPNKNGTGGPGYKIQCEVSAPKQYHDRGVLSMAHAGRNTGGSQFFICHNRTGTQHLDGNHTCFGRVIEGERIIDAIRAGDAILSISIIPEVQETTEPDFDNHGFDIGGSE